MNQKTRLNIIGIVILVIGLGSAVWIYVAAENAASSAVGYDIIDGKAYPVSPENSKRYLHDLELYGGKMAVLSDEFNRWFDSLWQGTTLAYTVACLTVLIAAGFFFVARHMSMEGEADGEEGK
jgi:hypothetical protein